MSRNARVLVVCASPRRDGNSAILGEAAADGARAAGHDVEVVHLIDDVHGMLRDCRTCRTPAGACSIDDGYEALLVDKVLPADAVIYATPLHYYGMTGRLKTFFDRLFCYTSDSAPNGAANAAALPGKQVGLLISCEESYVGANLGLIAQFQELTRYNRQTFAGYVIGVANSRGEIIRDPADPIARATELGLRIMDITETDYRLDTDRGNQVWATN
jgi:multimeric flavodoxin WrbA